MKTTLKMQRTLDKQARQIKELKEEVDTLIRVGESATGRMIGFSNQINNLKANCETALIEVDKELKLFNESQTVNYGVRVGRKNAIEWILELLNKH